MQVAAAAETPKHKDNRILLHADDARPCCKKRRCYASQFEKLGPPPEASLLETGCQGFIFLFM